MNSFLRAISSSILLLPASYAVATEPGVAIPNTTLLRQTPQARAAEIYGRLPLSFEPNEGQVDSKVKFLSQGDGYSLSLTSTQAILSLPGKKCASPSEMQATEHLMKKPQSCVASSDSVIRMGLLGSNPDAQIRGEAELPGKSNYFIGKSSSDWHTNISNYRKVQYQEIYPGIDLVYYGNQRQLEHDFIVAPGADPKNIRLNFEGAQQTSIDGNGNLVLTTDEGTLLLKQPVVYQDVDGERKLLSGRYVRSESNEIGFDIDTYDKTKALVIDPVLAYSTFVGGSSFTVPIGVGVDSEGNTYVVARSSFSEYVEAVLVTKVDQAGSSQIYSTLIGPALAYGMAVDAQGNTYITGSTTSTTFPVVNAFQGSLNGSGNAFLAKIDPSGTKLVYSTYFGATTTYGRALAVDTSGSAYMTGVAGVNLPVVTPLSTGPGPFITKFSPSGDSLKYSTYIAGEEQIYDTSNAIAVDPAGEAVLTGETKSKNFPSKNGLYRKCVGRRYAPCDSVFITKVNASGTGLIYSTFLGAGAGLAVATNSDGDAFVSGYTYPKGFPIVNALYPTTSADSSSFMTRINATGSALVYSTFLPHTGVTSIAVDKDSNVYATGGAGADLPVIDAFQTQFGGGGADAFVFKLNESGSRLLYSTFLGGSQSEAGQSIAVDSYNSAYVIGDTFSTDFPLKNPISKPPNPEPTFLAKISEPSVFTITNTVDHTTVRPGGALSYTITITNTGSVLAPGVLVDKTVRGPILSCQSSHGDLCKFVPRGGTATVNLTPFAPGESRVVMIATGVAKTAGDYNEVGNIATFYSSPPVYERDFASAPATVRETADISIATSVVDSTNGLLHYRHTVRNLGPDNAHAILLLDSLPAYTSFVSASTTLGSCSFKPNLGGPDGAVRCPIGNPAAGYSVQVDVVVKSSLLSCPTATNTTSVISQSIDPGSGNDSATVTTQLPQSACPPRPPATYKVSLFKNGGLPTYRQLNNNGDLLGAASILFNDSSEPTQIPIGGVGFNDLDEVVGTVGRGPEEQQGVYKNGSFHALDFGADFYAAEVLAINNAGQIAGVQQGFSEDENANTADSFLYQNGSTRNIGHLTDSLFTLASSLNVKGEIAGYGTRTRSYTARAFLYTHNLLLDLAPDYPVSSATAVDSSGRVTGYLINKGSNVKHVFLYSGGKIQDLGSPSGGSGYYGVQGTSINDCGEVVAFDYASNAAFLYTHGNIVDLNTAASLATGYFVQPIAINNRGQILGYAYNPRVGSDTVLLTPPVLEKCGLDATIDNSSSSMTVVGGGNVNYTIHVNNLDTATSQFTVSDALDATTSLLSCTVTGGGGTCTGTPGSHSLSVGLSSLSKGSSATIIVKVKAAGTYPAGSVIMNTATLSSTSTVDYLSTAYTSVP